MNTELTSSVSTARRTFRVVELDHVEHPAFLALSPTQQQLHTHLSVVSHPVWGVALSGKELGSRTGRHERTCRRNLRVLEELDLIEVQRGGGAHAHKNRIWVKHRTSDGRVRLPTSMAPRDVKAPIPPKVAPASTALPLEAEAAAAETLNAEQLARLVAELQNDDMPQDAIDAIAADPLAAWQMARDRGLLQAAAAPAGDPRDAERIVREWCAAWRIGRPPMRSELNLAQRLIQYSGPEAWAFVVAAQSRLVERVNKGAKPPWSMHYLELHLDAVGARHRRPDPTRPPDKPPD